MYKLNLLEKMKIYPIQYIIILEPAHGNVKPLVYKVDTYRGQEEDKWEVLKIVSYKDINNKTTQEPLDNLKNAIRKVQEYQRKIDQAVLIRKDC